MTDGPPTGGRGRRPRESYAERRARRAEVDDPEIVLAAALRFLEARARSVVETRRRLADAGYRPELIDGTVERLLAIGLLDDPAFARHWIESRDRASPRGEIALRRELRLRGVDGAVIDEALDERQLGAQITGSTCRTARPTATVDGAIPTSSRRIGCSNAVDGTWTGWRTRASGVPGRTRCSPAMGSAPRSPRACRLRSSTGTPDPRSVDPSSRRAVG